MQKTIELNGKTLLNKVAEFVSTEENKRFEAFVVEQNAEEFYTKIKLVAKVRRSSFVRFCEAKCVGNGVYQLVY